MSGLTESDLDLIQFLADTSRGFGPGSRRPETLSLEVVLRIAEKCYRRGFQQGADFMRRHITGLDDDERGDGPRVPGYAYARGVQDWRYRGGAERYATGELPPRGPEPKRVAS